MAQIRKTAAEMLNREFLEIRCRLIEVAAALDRIDRSPNPRDATADVRHGQIEAALRLLASGVSDRAERVQMVFSDDYRPDWREHGRESS
jgi:hypothetical protein